MNVAVAAVTIALPQSYRHTINEFNTFMNDNYLLCMHNPIQMHEIKLYSFNGNFDTPQNRTNDGPRKICPNLNLISKRRKLFDSLAHL